MHQSMSCLSFVCESYKGSPFYWRMYDPKPSDELNVKVVDILKINGLLLIRHWLMRYPTNDVLHLDVFILIFITSTIDQIDLLNLLKSSI